MSCFRRRLILLAAVLPLACGLQAQIPGVPAPPPGPDIPGGPPAPDAALLPGQPAPPSQSADEGDGAVSTPRMRDPFWPVGYTPKVVRRKPAGVGMPASSPVAVVPEVSHVPQWDEARRKLDIRGISLIGRDKVTGKARYLAMVAGKLVEEGDVVNVTYEDRVYRWKVVGIGTAGVTFQKLDVK